LETEIKYPSPQTTASTTIKQ